MAYATKADLARYLGVNESDLPADVERLLERASELIDEATMGRIDVTKHADVAKLAVCAQYEYWREVDETLDVTGAPESFSVSDFSMQGRMATLAPRARRHLLLSGLLYRGVLGVQ